MKLPDDKYLILFDGYCHLCSRTVQIILKFDKHKKFLFAPLSSNIGRYWKKKLSIPDQVDSVILIIDNNYLTKSDVVFKISNELGGLFYLVNTFKIIPLRVRDNIYDYIARNRIKWFGRRNKCYIPDLKHKN